MRKLFPTKCYSQDNCELQSIVEKITVWIHYVQNKQKCQCKMSKIFRVSWNHKKFHTLAEIRWVSCNHSKANFKLFMQRALLRQLVTLAVMACAWFFYSIRYSMPKIHSIRCYNSKSSVYYNNSIFSPCIIRFCYWRNPHRDICSVTSPWQLIVILYLFIYLLQKQVWTI